MLTLDILEREAILRALARNGNVQKLAARELGISARSIHYRIHSRGIPYEKGWERTPPFLPGHPEPVADPIDYTIRRYASWLVDGVVRGKEG